MCIEKAVADERSDRSSQLSVLELVEAEALMELAVGTAASCFVAWSVAQPTTDVTVS